jgi:hypothetical protein
MARLVKLEGFWSHRNLMQSKSFGLSGVVLILVLAVEQWGDPRTGESTPKYEPVVSGHPGDGADEHALKTKHRTSES